MSICLYVYMYMYICLYVYMYVFVGTSVCKAAASSDCSAFLTEQGHLYMCGAGHHFAFH